MVNSYENLLKKFIPLFSITILIVFFGYLTRILLSKNLSFEEFGLYYSVLNFYILISFFSDLSFGVSIVRFGNVIPLNKLVSYVFLVKMTFYLALVSLIYYFKNFIIYTFFKTELAIYGIYLIMILLLSKVFISIIAKLLQYLERNNMSRIIESIEKPVLFSILFFYISFIGSMNFILLCLIISFIHILIILIYGLVFYYKIKLNFKISKSEIKKINLFSFNNSISSFALVLIGYIDSLFLNYYFTVGVVGIYSSILATALLFSYVGEVFSNILFPKFVKLDDSILFLKNSKFLIFIFILVLIIPIYFISEYFLLFLFNSEIASYYLLLNILLIAPLFQALSKLNTTYIRSKFNPLKISYVNWSGAFVNIVLCFILIPKFSLYGAGIATVISYFATYLVSELIIFYNV